MKKKKFAVNYSTTTSYDAVVTADSKEEAIKKVREIIGEPVEIESVWEVHPHGKNKD